MCWGMGLRARDQRNERGGGSAHAGCTQGELLPLHDAIGYRLVYRTIKKISTASAERQPLSADC